MDIPEFLRREGADRLHHGSSSTLYTHLLNTRDILRAWRQPVWIQNAGAIHSIYSTDVYRRELVPPENRGRVAEIAGEPAERLAWLFGSILRKSFFAALDACGSVPEGLQVGGRAGTGIRLSREDILCLLVLYMANKSDQAQDQTGGPGFWLSQVSGWGRRLREGVGPWPPIFDCCLKTVSAAEEHDARQLWCQGLESISRDPDMARSRFVAAHRACRWIAEPLVGMAWVAAWKGDTPGSRAAAAKAAEIFRQWSTAWDKRLPFEKWLDLAESLARGDLQTLANRPVGAHPEALPAEYVPEGDVPAGSVPEVSTPGQAYAAASNGDAADRRLQGYLRLFAANQRHPRMSLYPGLSSRPWHEAGEFEAAHALESAFEAIRNEALSLERVAFHSEIEGIQRSGAWHVFPLYELGRKNQENCSLCPATTRVVEEHATLRSLSGMIYFSRMSPGTHIMPHRGKTNLRVRCHLGLHIPAGDCALRVGTETRYWQQGRCMVFDDLYEHEAWNRTGEDRIVLIVDLWHPELTPGEIAAIEGLQRYASLHARDLSTYWSKNAEARLAARELYS